MGRELPILFNSEMVRAILDGRKTQTRRPIKPQPPKGNYNCATVLDTTGDRKKVGKHFWHNLDAIEHCDVYFSLPYQVGDRLYVRETFAIDGYKGNKFPRSGVFYKADENKMNFDAGQNWKISDYKIKWTPNIHMPKECARIWLEVTGVRVERVQDISNKDIESEGIEFVARDGARGLQESFKSLWNSIYKNELSFESNPYVFVTEFKRIEAK